MPRKLLLTDRTRIQSMILEVIIEFIVDKNRSRHGGGDFEGESAVGEGADGTVAVVLDADFLDGVGENKHGNADADEDDGHDEEESDGFGERWDGQDHLSNQSKNSIKN